MARHESDYPFVYVTVDIVVLTLRSEGLSVLAIRRDRPPYAGELALPGGFVGPDEGLLAAARRELTEETGLDGRRLVLDQLATYGAPDRDPRHRIVSVAHLAVTPEAQTPRAGSDARSADWLPVAEVAGKMAFDHDQILADAITRLRGKLEYTALAASFLPEEFTLADLRGVYETIWGTSLDPGNFQRKIRSCTDFVRPTGELRSVGRGRPAELFVALKSGTDRLAVPIIGAYI